VFLLVCLLAACSGAGPDWRGGVKVTTGDAPLAPGLARPARLP